jgi:hypothetical protein
MTDARTDKLLGGFVLLHVLCCGVPLLIAAGVVTGAALLTCGAVLIAVSAAPVTVGVLAVQARDRTNARCCTPHQNLRALHGRPGDSVVDG